MKSVRNITKIYVKSFNQLRLIKTLYNLNLPIFNLNIISHNEFNFDILSKNKKKFFNFLKNKNITYEVLAETGILNLSKKILYRIGILCSIICFIGVFITLSFFTLKIEVVGNSLINKNDVIRVLKDNGVDTLTLKNKIDKEYIENLILNNFDTVSMLSVAVKGSTLIISIKEKIYNSEIEDLSNFQSLISNYNGYITNIELIQGTLAVKVGDLVRLGDVLVYPYVNDSSNNKIPIKPLANIYACVYLTSELSHYEREIVTVRTGRSCERVSVMLFGKEIYNKSNYISFESYQENFIITNLSDFNIIPFKLVKHQFFETKIIEKYIPFEQVKTDYLKKAKEIAYSFVNNNDIIKNEKTVIQFKNNVTTVKYIIEAEVKIGV